MAMDLRIASYNTAWSGAWATELITSGIGFHSRALQAQPVRLPELEDRTPMPSETEPSDHLPIAARLMRT